MVDGLTLMTPTTFQMRPARANGFVEQLAQPARGFVVGYLAEVGHGWLDGYATSGIAGWTCRVTLAICRVAA